MMTRQSALQTLWLSTIASPAASVISPARKINAWLRRNSSAIAR